ncbi:MAG: hypothetical protein V2J14_10670 [Erythrobacter sp.]|jgi:hypothetical protein|nr:hypothetical protein [Erythrobacter sp.]
MTRNRLSPARRSLVPLVALAALAACGPDREETAPLAEGAEDEIIGSEPVPDHEPGQSPPAINDPTEEGPPLINRTGPDRDQDGVTDVEIQ